MHNDTYGHDRRGDDSRRCVEIVGDGLADFDQLHSLSALSVAVTTVISAVCSWRAAACIGQTTIVDQTTGPIARLTLDLQSGGVV